MPTHFNTLATPTTYIISIHCLAFFQTMFITVVHVTRLIHCPPSQQCTNKLTALELIVVILFFHQDM